MQLVTVVSLIALTFAAYWVFRKLYLRYVNPLINVVVLSAAVIIAVLSACGMTFKDYAQSKNILTYLLGPATVGLAVPLYRCRSLLVKYRWTIVVGIVAGSLASLFTAVIIAKLGGLSREVIASLAPKSVTIPFAMEIARIAGGDASLATAFVVATGTLGSVLGPSLLTWLNIKDPVARGLALGCVSHGQGTAMALQEGEQQGAVAGVAMALAGIFTSLVAPFILARLL